jgi:hypothetical protein
MNHSIIVIDWPSDGAYVRDWGYGVTKTSYSFGRYLLQCVWDEVPFVVQHPPGGAIVYFYLE